MSKKIGIIGTGIAGLSCAHNLFRKNEITLFESADYVGGHTHTVDVVHMGEKARIDTGFIVFNDKTYPNFIRLMKELNVPYQPTEMSFSVRNDSIDLEYNGHNLSTLFAQRSNLFHLSFYYMLYEIVRFNREVRKQQYKEMTLGDYIVRKGYSPLFVDNYLLPMVSAIWSMGLDSCMNFPLVFFTRFFKNHGLLDITNRPQWHSIIGGSSSYIEPLTAPFRDRIHLRSAVKSIQRTPEQRVIVQTDSDEYPFDEVILACHGDQALSLLSRPNENEAEILKNFHFTNNSVILHTDTSLMPKRKRAWASWNYRMVDTAKQQTALTYNMNILQCLKTKHTYLVSLNQPVRDEYVLDRFSYSHPVYSQEALSSQEKWQNISGIDRVHYCGAYWLNGFHEDGVKSALRVVKMVEEMQ